MKSAILIGKFNEITREVSANLASQCQVQLCADNREIMTGMLQMMKPDVVIVLLTGVAMTPSEMISVIIRECPVTPLLIVGNHDDEAALSSKGYLDQDWILFLRRPVRTDKVCKHVEDLLSEDFAKKIRKKKREQAGEEEEEGPKLPAVLLVDDSPTLLRSMQILLSKKYRVFFATSGFQAISSISKNRPDIILLDYEMPVCDGKMTLQMLRAEESTKDIPVIFLTGMADSVRVIDALEYKPDGYLLKPCSETKLFGTIESVLREHTKLEDWEKWEDWEG